MPDVVSPILNAFLLSVLLVIALDRVSRHVGLVDVPDARKTHVGLVPLTGGLAIFAAFLVAIALNGWPALLPWTVVLGLSALVALGVCDDLCDVGPYRKLAGQIAAAAVMVVPGGHLVTELPGILGSGPWHVGPLAAPFTILFVVGVINAVNMIDGLDGLGGGVAAIALMWLAIAGGALHAGYAEVALVGVFAILGFLVFNMPNPWRRGASAFLGDAGSMMLGGLVAYFIVRLGAEPQVIGHGSVAFVALLWICALPAIDTLSLLVRRSASGRNPMACDREHLHHVLIRVGLTPTQTTMVLLATSFVCGGIGVLGLRSGVPDAVMLAGLVMLVGAHSLLIVQRDRLRLLADAQQRRRARIALAQRVGRQGT